MPEPRPRLIWLTTYAVAMAYLESAVVVYLRALYYPDGFSLPFVPIEPRMAAIEVGREAATLVMLLGVAAVMSTDRWDRFLVFCLGFGVWDIWYYVWLWVLLGWPPSLLTWDVLFLIPVPWVGPVLAPLIVSAALITGSLLFLRARRQGMRPRLPGWLWAMAVAGGGAVLLSFMLDFRVVLAGQTPPPFRWGLFGIGITCGVAALALGLSDLSSRTAPQPLERRARR